MTHQERLEPLMLATMVDSYVSAPYSNEHHVQPGAPEQIVDPPHWTLIICKLSQMACNSEGSQTPRSCSGMIGSTMAGFEPGFWRLRTAAVLSLPSWSSDALGPGLGVGSSMVSASLPTWAVRPASAARATEGMVALAIASRLASSQPDCSR